MPAPAKPHEPQSVLAGPFLVLPENRFAHTAVSRLALPTKKRPSFVFVHGPAGVGKSHLVAHAAQLFEKHRSGTRVQHVIASQFRYAADDVAELRKLIDTGDPEHLPGLFILEDVQALQNHEQPQRQLRGLLDELAAHGCRVIVTARCSAGELQNFLPQLVNRFHSAVTAVVRLPGLSSRQSLLAHFATARRVTLPDDVVRRLAKSLPASPRELLAAVVQLELLARHARQPISLALANKWLSSDERPDAPTLTEIVRVVAAQFDVPVATLRSRSRSQAAVLPRQCAMYLARELTDASQQAIGEFFDRDHSTVVHACQRIDEMLADDAAVRLHLSQARLKLGRSGR
jgi:chromosomal replication initiator protein